MAKHFLGRTIEGWARRLPALREPVWRLEAALASLLLRVCHRLPPDAASAAGERVGRLIGPRSYKHRHVLANLAIAFPGRDTDWYERTARAMWGNLGRVLVELALLERFLATDLADRIEVVDRGGLAVARRSGRPAVFVGAHLGNWELTQLLAPRYGLPLAAVHARQSNPYLDRLVARCRAVLPTRFLAVEEAARALPAALSEGRSLGLLIDQRYDDGELVPFFGRPAPTAVAPARLALRHGVPFVPVRIERLEGLQFRITICEPVEPELGTRDRREAALAMTARVNALFEDWIRARPGQWLCAKRRWPKGPDDRKLRVNRRRAA